MRRTYKYRIEPTEQQAKDLNRILFLCCGLYNMALRHLSDSWKDEQKTISEYDQVKYFRSEFVPQRLEYKARGYSHVFADVFTRVHKARKAFFKKYARYPKIHHIEHYTSFTFPDLSGWKLIGNRLKVSTVGTIKVRLHRSIEGVIKTLTISRESNNKWYACFSCDEVPVKESFPVGHEIGIDPGLEVFLTTSDNEVVENPRHTKKVAVKLARLDRMISKSRNMNGNRDSKRNKKRKEKRAKLHKKLANTRKDFQYKVARSLIDKTDLIAIENTNWKGLASGDLRAVRKSLHDVAHGQFKEILKHKAEEYQREFIEVDPKNTTQQCSRCGNFPSKRVDLSMRVYECEHCHEVMDRDHNAGRNILLAALKQKELVVV